MTAGTLYSTLEFIESLDNELSLQSSLVAVAQAMTNLASSPAQPQIQAQLADALTQLAKSFYALRSSVTPSKMQILSELGGADFFDPKIADTVTETIQKNAVTPSVSREFVQNLVNQRDRFLTNVRTGRQALKLLGIQVSTVPEGTANIAVLIPRDLFQNNLDQFTKELKFLNQLLEDISEGMTGTRQRVQLESLSSSEPTIGLTPYLTVIQMLGNIVVKFLEAWEKVKKLRKLKEDIDENGMTGAALDEVTERIDATVEEVVEESTKMVLVTYPNDNGRKNELEAALKRDALRLFGQIERGLTIEFKPGETSADLTGKDQKSLEDIAVIASTIKFPEVSPQPMLLSSGEVIEGEIRTYKRVKTTTHTKTTTTKKPGTSEKAKTDGNS